MKRSPLTKEQESEYVKVSTPSQGDGDSTADPYRGAYDKNSKNQGGFGIFDKIYNYLNR